MLSEQLAPSAALHLSCSSAVAVNLKTKDESRCSGFQSNNNNCNNNNKIHTFQQIRHHYDCNNQKVNKLATSSVVGVKAAATITTTVATTAATSANNVIINISASSPSPSTPSTVLPSPTAARTTPTTATVVTALPTTAATITTSANAVTITTTTTTTTTINTFTPLRKKESPITKKSIAPPSTQKVINDASGRSAALERAYVHDVYENCEEPTGPIRPRVAQFLGNLDPGSVVCDVGCGSGRYLTQCNPLICTVGVDRCYRLSKVAREKGGEVALCDNLELPFRDESFDAVLSLAVVHHFATTERRVGALRELARILRVGGRVVITVWALEQRHRRFESQDVLIPWQPPKNRNFNYSDDEDAEDFLPPYHAYTEDSTNSSRSAGDGDSSSLSSSSPGESCYSFVRRAIQKLAGGRKHPWFLDSWTSKDTKNDSSLDYEDARDLPIELRRLEDFEDFPDPPLSAGLKSRSLGSILNPPPRQIVRSRSSVPCLGGPLLQLEQGNKAPSQQQPIQTVQHLSANADNNAPTQGTHSPTAASGAPLSGTGAANARRPKLIKQKQSLCDEDCQLPENPFHVLSSYNSNNNSVNSSLYTRTSSHQHHPHPSLSGRQTSLFLRKQSSLNEELMAGNRIREKERVRKRIQKQMSLNEAFLCRSAVFSRRLQVIREGFSTKIKTSTGSLERLTKNGISKIMQNLKGIHPTTASQASDHASTSTPQASATQNHSPQPQHHQHHHHHHNSPYPGQSSLPQILHKPISFSGIIATKFNAAAVSYCSVPDCTSSSTPCYCSAYHSTACHSCNAVDESQQNKPRRSSRESGSDSSKDSLQSDTSIESEDSFASVIFIPKPEHQHQQQQQLNYQQQHHNSNSSSSNSSSSNGGCCNANANACRGSNSQPRCIHFNHGSQSQPRLSSVPTSPLIMPCPPTPAHSPAAAQVAVTSPPQSVAAVSAAMAILTPPTKDPVTVAEGAKRHFNFDEADVKHQRREEERKSPSISSVKLNTITQPAAAAVKITRQTIKDLPPIPKFRKQQSLQLQRQSFPIVRRSSATAGALPSLPKLMSLELFNPATDDLDSDSSEPSSPDSVDSVISAPRLTSVGSADEELPQNAAITSTCVDEASSLDQIIKLQQEQYNKGELSISLAAQLSNDNDVNTRAHTLNHTQPPTCAAFAEQLSAQLQRELDDKDKHGDCHSLECIGDIDNLDDRMSHKKRSNGETRDLSAFREELRERRLMLANLSTQPSLQQSPTSSSTSSLSSQTRSFTIHEEDEDDEECEEENERSYMLQLYENCKISKFSYKRNRHYNLNPETAYLLQDDGDSSVRDDDEIDDMEHDVIPEEDEADEAVVEADGGDKLGESFKEYGRKNSRSRVKCGNDHRDDEVPECPENPNTHSEQPPPLQNHRSTEFWEHSNSSTTSLDSPSQGGATTHHRYYHVFREGELDALINHHVASLHIVSSYYERASWCVVAEKVQVWTI